MPSKPQYPFWLALKVRAAIAKLITFKATVRSTDAWQEFWDYTLLDHYHYAVLEVNGEGVDGHDA
jgi:hypothetical protein